ncbi:MAG TPA: ribonuclease E inhibitor RraB [Candidatus Dormibacteraeota bacterium]|nr:ribonuclease E inhibitor RraB [Candidatus Dormibacteraeota bacterium]
MGWLDLFWPRPARRRRPPESRRPPHPDDLARIAELEQRGSRLDLPHPIHALLTLGSEAAGRLAADRLERAGYRCALRSRRDGAWSLTATLTLVPSPGAITGLREQLEEVASDLGGAYEGWEAPIVY